MHLSQLLDQYGYIAVFVAGLFEGETILMLGAYAVHQGYLHLAPLIAVGAAAGFVSDQFYFQLGRRHGPDMLAKRPKFHALFNKVSGFVERHPVVAIFVMRFAWGFRIVLPVALGLSRTSTLLYAVLNAVAAVLWATIIVFFGVTLSGWARAALASVEGHLRPHQHDWKIFIGMVALAVIVALIRYYRAAK